MQTLLATIVVLGVLIFVHELGHFLAAKSVGIAVLRFSFGLGSPTPLSFRRGETEYCISWIPLGGYVKMAGLEEDGPAAGVEGPKAEIVIAPERTFDAKSLPARMFVISAGVIMNVLFAVLVYTGLTMRYGVAEDPSITIGEVRGDSLPLGASGLETIQPGDRIVRINGDSVRGWRDIQGAFLTSSTNPLRLEIAGRAQPVLVDVPLSQQQGRVAALRSLIPWHEPVVGDVLPGQAASKAGLQRGDRFLTVNGDTVLAWEKLVKVIETHAGDTLRVRLARGSQVIRADLVPRATLVPAADSGARREVGKVGLGVYLPLTRYGFFGSVRQGVIRAADAGGLVLFTLKGLLTGQLSPRDLGGPILVGQLSGEAIRLGLDVYLGFMALFSMNLAVLNMLPIPVLDGGHLLFLVIEGIRRKPLSIVQRQRFTQVGFFLLLAIMVLALANDFTRVFHF